MTGDLTTTSPFVDYTIEFIRLPKSPTDSRNPYRAICTRCDAYTTAHPDVAVDWAFEHVDKCPERLGSGGVKAPAVHPGHLILDTLTKLTDTRAQLYEAEYSNVKLARRVGCSWESIAKSLDTTPELARARFPEMSARDADRYREV